MRNNSFPISFLHETQVPTITPPCSSGGLARGRSSIAPIVRGVTRLMSPGPTAWDSSRCLMLFSPSSRIAFAHYPKAAGTSLSHWFHQRFPDAYPADPNNGHLPVRPSLERLGFVRSLPRSPRLVRETARLLQTGLKTVGVTAERCDITIIGVLRDPFEMLVSLYEYWHRRGRFEDFADPLFQAARRGTFRAFFELAVIHHRVHTYKKFFDVGGPAWPTTRLIDFHSLEQGLAIVSRELRIDRHAEPLATLNAALGGSRDIENYRSQVHDLMAALHARFHWYYESAWRYMIPSPCNRLTKAA